MISALSNQAETGRGGQLASYERNSDKLSLDCHNPDGDRGDQLLKERR